MITDNVDLKKYLSDIYIETGLKDGASLRKAIAAGFPEIHSVELNEEYVKKARLNAPSHVHVHHGDSRAVLGDVVGKIGDRKATFFLDAHGGRSCPLLAELAIIYAHSRNDHTIIIDDTCLLLKRYDIDLGQIISSLFIRNPEYKIEIYRGYPKDNSLLVAS